MNSSIKLYKHVSGLACMWRTSGSSRMNGIDLHLLKCSKCILARFGLKKIRFYWRDETKILGATCEHFQALNNIMVQINSIFGTISVFLVLLLSIEKIPAEGANYGGGGVEPEFGFSSSEIELFDLAQTPPLPLPKEDGEHNDFGSKVTTESTVLLLTSHDDDSKRNGPISPDTPSRRQFDGSRDEGKNVLVEVRIPVLEFTDGPFVRVFGRSVNHTVPTPFGEQVLTVLEFKGISYAEPPLKSLRFQRPILKPPQNGFRALQHGERCPQIAAGNVVGNEDCLHLNIYVPDNSGEGSGKSLPVLVWLHGESPESFTSGRFSMFSSGGAEEVEPLVFVQHKVIVVVPQYRLGSLGLLSAANEDLNGNMALFDQLLALEWIQKYIASFGGDPNQVTVQGHGSAGTSLGLLATSGEMARGLFHRIIIMSGSPLSPVALDLNQKLTFAEVAFQNSCPTFPTLQFVRCMQKKDARSIVLADENLVKGRHLGKFRSPLPVIQKEDDMRFLPPLIYSNPESKLKLGSFQDVPIIIGVTRSEMFGFLSSITGKPESFLEETLFSETNVLRQFIRAILSRTGFALDSDIVARLTTFEYFSGLNVTERHEQAKDLLEEMVSDYLYYIPALSLAKMWSKFAPVYLYVFDYIPSGMSPEGKENDGEGGLLRNERQTTADGVEPATQAIHGSDLLFLMQGYKGSAQDRHIAAVFTDSLVNFIHKGSPLQSGLDWPEYRESTKKYLYLSETIQVRSKFRARQEQFWTELLKELGERTSLTSAVCRVKGSKS